MDEEKKVTRRKFLVGSTAVVGATAIAAGEQKSKLAGEASARFTSPAGSVIPFSEAELLATGTVRSFSGAQLGEIAFPLGGIGTGTVSLGGRGDLRDWEIFNRPGKGRDLPYTFFAIWARPEGADPIARVLERRFLPPYSGGFGIPTSRVAGLPRRRLCGWSRRPCSRHSAAATACLAAARRVCLASQARASPARTRSPRSRLKTSRCL